MFKTSHLILLGLIAVGLFLLVNREHLTVNKDNSKNWDVPERSSLPLGTPQEQEIQDMKARIRALEEVVKDLKK
jgi:hypothetical protein